MKESVIGVKLHRDLAHQFMEIAEDDGTDTEIPKDKDEIERHTDDMRKLYLQLRNEENKSENLEKNQEVINEKHAQEVEEKDNEIEKQNKEIEELQYKLLNQPESTKVFFRKRQYVQEGNQ